MFQLAAHYAYHADVLRVSRNTGHQTRYPAHEQGRLHTRAACLGQLFDDVLVGYGVGLHENPAGPALGGLGNLLVDGLTDLLLNHKRGHPQALIVVHNRLKLHIAEELGRVGANLGVAGNHGQVSVELGRLLVVVACAQLGDELQAVMGAARDGADLGVHLEVAKTVDDGTAGLLKALRPFDIVALVKACTQFKEGRDLLAIFGGCHQGLG